MKQTIFKDDAFTLEVEKDEFNNVRLTQFFKQGKTNVDIDEILLPKDQQHALKDYLNELLK